MSVIMTYLLHFLCLCNYENRMRFGMVELETGIPFVSALTFRYLCPAIWGYPGEAKMSG